MEALFIRILNMSLTAGYCIVAVILLRFMLKRQAKILSYLLWSVVLFRLLCPFSLTSSYSLLRMDTGVVSGEVFSGGQQTVWQGKGYLPDGAGGGDGTVKAVPFVSAAQAERTGMMRKALAAGAWLWIGGMVILIGCSVRTALRLRHFLSGARLVEEGVYETEEIATPFVFGVIRPRIYLPVHLQPEERRYVLAHERVHIARKDHLVKLIGWGALCLHWFNPFVWLAFKLMERDMEMSCDETVLRRLGEDVKQDYSRALLSLSFEESGFHASPMAFGEGELKGRIRNILSWKRGRVATTAVLAVPLCAAAAGLMLNPAGGMQREETEEKLRFLDTYANAYCDKDGNTLVELYTDEEAAYQSLPFLEKAGGAYIFGISSPWPDEFRYRLTEKPGAGEEGENRAEIWYYAWTSDPHVTVWKENIRFCRQESGGEENYRVTGSDLQYLDSIANRTAFDEAYLIGGAYQFTDYVERGYLEAVQTQTEYDRENGGEDRNAVYRSPETAAAWIFNLSGGSAEVISTDADGHAVVRYTFGDGSSVEIPMYNAAYRNDVLPFAKEDSAGGAADDVWFADLAAWKDYMYFVY